MDYAALATAVLALVVSWLSWRAAWRQARAAEEQTDIQREIQEATAQPYLWADFRIAKRSLVIHVLVRNEGPTIARDVRIGFDPPLESESPGFARVPTELASMPPGRTLSWEFDSAPLRLREESPLPTLYTVTLTAQGPFGPVEPNVFPLDLKDFLDADLRSETEQAEALETVRDAARTIAAAIGKTAKKPAFRSPPGAVAGGPRSHQTEV